MEKFLEFWSHYNAAIIEALIALILFSAIYLAYRTFFGSKGAGTHSATAIGVDSAQIEKTLQKILDQQSASHAAGAASTEGARVSAPPAEMVEELSTLKKALEEKEKQIVILRDSAAAAAKATQATGASGVDPATIAKAAEAAAGLAEKERKDYEAKIKELEARLAEYEIISEDIADLSFFKEENQRLTKELEALKGGGAAPAAAPAAPAAPVAPAAAPAAAPAEATPAVVAAPAQNEVVDSNLMAEFAAAVEGQKGGATEEAPKKEGDAQLLEQFENFSKKS